MKGKEIMIVSGIIIVLSLVIIIGVKVNQNNDSEYISPQVGANGQEKSPEEFVEQKLDGTKVNTSETLSKTKQVEGLEVSNIRLTEKNNVSHIVADVKNSTSSEKGGFAVDIIVLDKQGKEIAKLGAYIDKVNPGATVELNTSATVDFANAYDFKISKK